MQLKRVEGYMADPAMLFRHDFHGDDCRVEWIDNDGAIEVAIFSGTSALSATLTDSMAGSKK
jgi:hypothetical protein